MKNYRFLGLVAAGCLLLAACGSIAQSIATGPGSWIDKPLDGSTIPLAPYEVVSHASSPMGIESFELSVDGEVIATDQVAEESYGESLAYIRQLWTPAEPGTYELSIRAFDLEGAAGPITSIQVHVGELVREPGASATPAATRTVATQERAQACTYEALVNLFCRQGASQRFPIVDSLTPGQQASVLAKSADGMFWYLEGPISGQMCTVPSGDRYGLVTGNCEGLPAFTPMPTPTDTPAPTLTPTATPTRGRESGPTSTPIPPPA